MTMTATTRFQSGWPAFGTLSVIWYLQQTTGQPQEQRGDTGVSSSKCVPYGNKATATPKHASPRVLHTLCVRGRERGRQQPCCLPAHAVTPPTTHLGSCVPSRRVLRTKSRGACGLPCLAAASRCCTSPLYTRKRTGKTQVRTRQAAAERRTNTGACPAFHTAARSTAAVVPTPLTPHPDAWRRHQQQQQHPQITWAQTGAAPTAAWHCTDSPGHCTQQAPG